MQPFLPAELTDTPLVVLVDDVRTFRDRRPHVQVRRGHDALSLLRHFDVVPLAELWLDHDLLDGTTSAPVVDHLVAQAEDGNPLNVKQIEVHTARVVEGLDTARRLRRAGYAARLRHSQSMWVRFDATLHHEWLPGRACRGLIRESSTGRPSAETPDERRAGRA